MASIADMKKNSKSMYEKILAETNKIQSGGGGKGDDRFWQPEVDKSGNGYAVIRFLPAPPNETEAPPWARLFSHGFQGPGGWYIENSRTTLGPGTPDPVSELNSSLWNRGDEAGKEIARKQKRRLTYISNILVVEDSANPENEGKVFLYRYGKKIHDKIKASLEPEFADESPVNPFDFWEGANFKLKIRNVEGYRNYDRSEFASPSVLFEGDDKKIEKLWNSQYSLAEFTALTNFKSYDELKTRLARVLGTPVAQSATAEEVQEEAAPASKSKKAPWEEDTDTSGSDNMDYFEELAN